MADIMLTVDYEFSTNLDATVNSLISSINAKIPKIKIQYDDSELKKLASTLGTLGSATKGTSGGGSSILPPASKVTQAASGVGELTKQVTTYNRASKEASRISSTYTNAITGTTTVVEEARRKNGQYVESTRKVTAAYKSEVEQRKEAADAGKSYATALASIEQKKLSLSKHEGGKESSEYLSLESHKSALEDLYKGYTDGNVAIDDYKIGLTNLQAEITKTGTAVSQFTATHGKLKSEVTAAYNKYHSVLSECSNAVDNFSAAEHSRNKSSRDAYAALKASKAELEDYRVKVNNSAITEEEFNTKVNEANQENKDYIRTIRSNGDAHKTLGQTIKSMAGKLASWMSMAQVITLAFNGVRSMASAVLEVDTAMTELKKVTNESDATYDAFLKNASSRASELGATLSDVITASADFARLGYNIDDASNLADAAIVYKNVGDGIDDISTASESIISAMQAFGVEASDSMSIVDKFNEVGNNFAISSDGIGQALLRSASSMEAAGNTLDETIALTTAANTVVQSPEKVGTALKTVSMRLRAATSEVEEAGESTDGMATSVSELRDEMLSLTGVDIQLDDSTFKSTYQILEEISGAWDELSDINQANILEKIAGKNQANVVAALLENFDIAKEALQTSLNSEGSALAENEKYLDSIQGRIDNLKNSFQTLSTDLMSSGAVKTAVSSLTGIVNAVDKVSSSLGSLGTVVAGVGIAKFLKDVVSASGGIKSFSDATTAAGMVAGETIGKIKSLTQVSSAFVTSMEAGNGVIASFGAGFSTLLSLINPVTASIVGIGIALSALSMYKSHIASLDAAAASSAKEWGESHDSLNDYIGRVTELRTQLASGALTEQEAYNAKSELLSIQQSLNETYGDAAGKLDLVNGGLERQIGLMQQLDAEEAKQFIGENESSIKRATKEMEKERSIYLGTGSGGDGEAEKAIRDAVKASQEKYGNLLQMDEETYEIRFTGDASEAQAVLSDFMADLSAASARIGDNDLLDSIMGYTETSLGTVNEVLDTYQETYEKGKLAAIMADDERYEDSNGTKQTAAKWMNDYAEAVEKYNDALASGDGSAISQAKSDFEALDSSIRSLSGLPDGYMDSFDEIRDQLDSAAEAAIEFQNAIEGKDTSDSAVADAANELKKLDLSDVDFEDAFATNNLHKGETQMRALADAALEAGVISDTSSESIKKLADMLVQLGILSGDPVSKLEGTAESIASLKTSLSTVLSTQNDINEVLSSVNSTTGLSTSQIDTLVDAYKDLEGSSGKAYGSQKILDKLFTKTASGVRVNTRQLEKYNSQLEKQTKAQYAEQIAAAEKALKNAQKNGADSDTISGLKEQLSTLKLLSAEYDGATSRFQKWVTAQETANSGANFDSISDTMNDAAQKLYDEGRTNTDDFRAAANYYSFEDLQGASQEKVEAAWNAAAKARERYFTGDKTGVDNFVSDIVTASKELGTNWAEVTKDGLIKFNTGADEGIAKYLGISVEAVQAIFKKGQEYTDDIIVGSTEETQKRLKDTQKALQDAQKKGSKSSGKKSKDDSDDSDSGSKKSGSSKSSKKSGGSKKKKSSKRSANDILNDYDLDYDATEMSLDEIDSKIKELKGAKVEIETEAKGVKGTKQVLKDLDGQIEALEDQKVIVQIQTAIDTAIQNGSSVDELLAMDDKTLAATLNIDTSQVDQAREQLESLSGENIESSITVKIDESQFNKLTETDTMNTTKTIHVNAVLNDTAEVDGYQPDDRDVTVTFDKDSSKPDKYQPEDKKATVTYKLIKPTYNPANLTRTLTYTIKTVGSVSSGGGVDATSGASGKKGSGTYPAAGTIRAQANGTAYNMLNLRPYAFGTNGSDVTIDHDQHSLINELGTEAVIRNGTLYEVPGGTHIESLKKGDVVINAAQWEQIKKYGKINTFAGKAYASGTLNGDLMSAYSSGTWKLGGRGTTSSKKKSSSSSSKSSSSSSSKSSSKSSSDDDEDDSEIIDWIEIAINRIERAIDRLGTVATSPFRKLSTRLNATNKELNKLSSELSLQQSAYKKYIKQANSVDLSSKLKKRVRNGTIKITEYSGDTAEKIQEYQEWYEKALACKDAILELKESMAELYQNKFDDIQSDYENQLSLIEHMTNTYNNGIDDLEERGYLASTKYYEALQKVEQQNIEIRKKELAALTQQMKEAIDSGYIKEYSEAWYEFQQNINEVKESIQESETAIVEFGNSIREIEWERFDYLQEQISNITEEADFLIDLMENSDLYDDNGQLTDTGMATMGLHGQNYNVYMAQADKYAEELLELNKKIAEDPYNTKLLERREELLESQRDAILAAEDEKQAIIDMVKDGIDLELEALQDLIDKYEDALDSQKDLYDYQKRVKEQTEEIASLEKQLSAYAGDDSEETKATIQQLKVDLQDAKDDLEETQYDQYISDTKKLLDDLYDQYEDLLNQRLDNVDALLKDMIDKINSSSSDICSTLLEQADKVGYTITDNERAIWETNGNGYSVIAQYGESFLSQMTTINDVISKIAATVGAMVTASDTTAETVIADTTPSTSTKDVTTDTSTKKDTTTKKDTSKTNSKTTKLTSAIKRGVATAIWVYGGSKTGWGDGSKRTKRLTEKFGSSGASSIQKYINNHGSNGDLYNAWVKDGKKKLSKYYYSAFKKGGLADYTGVAWLDGSPSEPEMVLNPKDTANFIALKDAMQSIADGSSPLAQLFTGNGDGSDILSGLATISNPQAGTSGTSIGDITYQVTIPIDHVQDYEDFMNQMRQDGKFEKMIQSMTVDRLAGGSKISKNKYKW